MIERKLAQKIFPEEIPGVLRDRRVYKRIAFNLYCNQMAISLHYQIHQCAIKARSESDGMGNADFTSTPCFEPAFL